jgi:hypothetical protein
MKIWQATQIADRSRNGELIPVEQLSEATRVLTEAYREALEENATVAAPVHVETTVEAPVMKGQWVGGYFISDTHDYPELVKLDFPHGPIFVPK